MARVSDASAADAHDEAVLDMIAMEMGAAGLDLDDTAMLIVEETHIEPQAPAEPVTTEKCRTWPHWRKNRSRWRRSRSRGHRSRRSSSRRAPLSRRGPSPRARPGWSLARLDHHRERHRAKPAAAANDPLAPIRRMSQAEKIAFFSVALIAQRDRRQQTGRSTNCSAPFRWEIRQATSFANKSASTLPPDRTMTTFLPLASMRPASSAARPTAPPGSTTSFNSRKANATAAPTSSSDARDALAPAACC